MSETVIKFNAHYQYVWLKNIGTGDCYVSDHPNIVAEDDDVAFLPNGEAVLMPMYNNAVYVLGDTVIEAHAQNFSDSPFAWNEAGEGGGSEPVIESITLTENGTYTAPSGVDGYSPVMVNVASGLDYVEQIDYVQTSDSATVGISIPVQPNDIIHLDMQILRHNSEQCVIGNKDYTSELYLNQSNLTRYGGYIGWTADMDMSPVAINERRVYKAEFYLSDNGYVNIMYYGSNPYPTYGNIYGIKVIRNGEEVMNIVPVKIHNVGLCFMYDTINYKIYFSNTGTDFAPPTID